MTGLRREPGTVRRGAVFIVELATSEGRVTERFETYPEARRRVERFPAEDLVGAPLIFQELPDGSQRLVRDDGKPLQFHRYFEEEEPGAPDGPLPVWEGASDRVGPDGKLRLVAPHPPDDDGDEDEPLPLA
jgi:hypothetical protein